LDETPVVVVIGAGVVGCSVAWELSRRGASVTLVDRKAPGSGATRAAAGILAPLLDTRASDPFRGIASRSLDMFEGFVTDVAVASGHPVEFCQCGSVEVAADPAAWQRLANSTHDRTATLADDALRERVPALAEGLAGGLFTARHGYVVVDALVSALVQAARHARVDVTTDREVTGVTFDGSLVMVETTKGRLGADVVVVAAGAASARVGLPAEFVPPLRLVCSQLLRLRHVPPLLRHVVLGARCYLVPWGDGHVLVGASVEDVDAEAGRSVAALRAVLDAACGLVPGLSRATFVGVSTGVRAEAPDALPIVGPSSLDPRVIYATGYYRSGVLLAPLTAAVVADLVVEKRRDPALDLMSPARLGL
jgi:glycine oxidase